MELILIKFEITSICILNAFLVSTFYPEEWVGLCVTVFNFRELFIQTFPHVQILCRKKA